MARYTYERENKAIREYFLNGLSYRQIAEKYGLSHEAVRDAKERGLRRLRIGKAKRLLLEKFDIVDAGIYRNSFNQFNEHGFTSTVEYITLRQAEIQEEYEGERRKLKTCIAIMQESKKNIMRIVIIICNNFLFIHLKFPSLTV